MYPYCYSFITSCGTRLKLIFLFFLGLVGSWKFTLRCKPGEFCIFFACNSEITAGFPYTEPLPEDAELFVDAILLEEICLGSELCLNDDLKTLLLNGEVPGNVLACRYCGGFW